MQKLLKIWNRKWKSQKFENIYQGRTANYISDFRSTRQMRGKGVVILVNMNTNQVFCLAIAVLLLQIINIQLEQMLALFAHVDQPKGLSELFVPHSSICRTVFYLSELYLLPRFNIQRIADAFDGWSTRAIGAIAGSWCRTDGSVLSTHQNTTRPWKVQVWLSLHRFITAEVVKTRWEAFWHIIIRK